MIKRKISFLVAIVMMATLMFPMTALAGPTKAPDSYKGMSYKELFLDFYSKIKDPKSGYFSPDEGIPYHSIETLIVEAPDYGHVTTSEAFSYYTWLEAMYGNFSGDWAPLKNAWKVMEDWIIPDSTEQPGMARYNPSSPATYANEYELPDYYPSKLEFNSVTVGQDPVHNDLTSAYGADMYLMHWLMDVDNWYGFGTGTEATFINTFQRGEQESTWETIPHPSKEEFKFGGRNGFLDLFTIDNSYAQQWRYTNAPDAEARAIQSIYWAWKWAEAQGKGSQVSDLVAKASKMGDFLRNDMFDKYFMKIGAQAKTPGNGYDSAHFLLAWYTSWGGGLKDAWAWKIGCSHAHFGYQSPFAAWVMAEVPAFAPKSSRGKKDWEDSLQRQIEFYQWLQSAEGGIAGGATNSWNGRYEKYPAGKSTFYGMAYTPHPVYADPGSNQWFGMQVWSMQRMIDLYLESGKAEIRPLIDKWVQWAMSNVKLYDDMTFEIPSDQEWTGEPDTWNGKYTGNPNLHVTIKSWGNDLGVTGSLANCLATYAAATQRWDGEADEDALIMAAELVNRAWYNYYCEEGKGVVTEESRADYSRFFTQEVYVPAGWSGTMPNGDKIQPGIKFIDIRSKYRQDPDYQKVYDAYQRGEAPVLNYHRFWHEVDLAIAMGVLATYFPEMKYDNKPITGDITNPVLYGDVNDDGLVDSLDVTILKRIVLRKYTGSYNAEAADVNADKALDSFDVTILKGFVLRKIDKLPYGN